MKPTLITNCQESEIRICDIASVIEKMGPIQIIIDKKSVWDDNTDITGLSDAEILETMKEEKKKFKNILSLTNIISSINFQIVDYHHSIVWITTKK